LLAAISFLIVIPRVEPVRLRESAPEPRDPTAALAAKPALDRA
jgi:hypothetical protein